MTTVEIIRKEANNKSSKLESLKNALLQDWISNIENDRANFYKNIITEDVFEALWTQADDDQKLKLLVILSSTILYPHRENTSISIAYSIKKVSNLFKLHSESLSDSGEFARQKIFSIFHDRKDIVGNSFSILLEIKKLENNKNISNTTFNNWIQKTLDMNEYVSRPAMNINFLSKDDFISLFKSVKKSDGHADIKRKIIYDLYKNHVEILDESVIKDIASSSFMRLRMAVVDTLSRYKKQNMHNYLHYHTKVNQSEKREYYLDRAKKAENLMLLFASVNNYYVCNTLSQNLDKDNLSWILPTAANFNSISKYIQSRMAK
jgi:hypothetical protein